MIINLIKLYLSNDGNDGSRFRHSDNNSFNRSRCFVPPNNFPSSVDKDVCNKKI
jgi:hypothetical protein